MKSISNLLLMVIELILLIAIDKKIKSFIGKFSRGNAFRVDSIGKSLSNTRCKWDGHGRTISSWICRRHTMVYHLKDKIFGEPRYYAS